MTAAGTIKTDTNGTGRPTPRSQLPFRQLNDMGCLVLECDVVYEDGQRAPYRLMDRLPLGDAENPKNALYTPIGHAICCLMRMYWDLEASVDAVKRERDDAVSRAAQAEGDLKECRQQVQGMKAQKAGADQAQGMK